MRNSRGFRIAIAPNAFKGTLSALRAARCIDRGFRRVFPQLSTILIPMADGGDGTVEAVTAATGGRILNRAVCDPLGRRIRAAFGLTGDRRTAIIEMARASGLALLESSERNPMHTSTFGTGELIRRALGLGVKKILVGIGGSATNDGGTGMARALGVRFLDRRGHPLPDGGGALARLDRIDMKCLDPRVRKATIEVACDVANPLTGPRGASRVYGPQKGATPAMVRQLDRNLAHLAKIIKRDIGVDALNIPGSGAAGGLGAGLLAFLGGRLRPGVDIVMETVELRKKLRGCDLVITGEGRMDSQTVFGKAPAGVARAAKELGIPVIAICGSLGPGVQRVRSIGILACFSSIREPVPEHDLPRRAPSLLADGAERVARLLARRGTFCPQRIRELGFQP